MKLPIRIFLITILISSTIIVFTACGNDNNTNKDTYTVTFRDYDEMIFDFQYVEHGKSATLPAKPSREGYVFIGWSDSHENITEDKTIYAEYQTNEHSVIFKDYSNNIISSQILMNGENADFPEPPVREGYTFIRWSEAGTNIQEDKIIFAEYDINYYTVTFNTNSDRKTEKKDNIPYNTIINLPQPTKDDYVFVQWELNGQLFEDNSLVKNDITLEAVWVPYEEYTISFNSSEGNYIDSIITVTYSKLESLPIPNKIDYAFEGWYFNDRKVETPLIYDFKKDITLVAKWRGLSEFIQYDIIDDEVTILNYTGSENSLIIPDTIDGKPVTTIASNAFKNNNTIESIVLGEYVTTIENDVFSDMESLKYLELTNNTKLIGSNLLYKSNSIEKIIISSELSYELKYFFGNNINFVPENLVVKYADGAEFIDKTLTQNNMNNAVLELADDWVEIEDSQFKNTLYLTSIIIPSGVEIIGDYAFSKSGISNANLPPSLLTIGSNAFSDSFLSSVTIPASVTTINDRAFYNATKLKEITFIKNIKIETINKEVFYGTTALEVVQIPNSIKVIEESAFKLSGVSEIIFEENSQLKTIGNSAFRDAKLLISIHIPKNVETIGSEAFSYSSTRYHPPVSSLTKVTFEKDSKLSTLGSSAFYNAISLTSINIPENVKTIGSSAFYNAISLTSINIPENVETIGSGAFSNAISLTSIYIPSSVKNIGSNAFYNFHTNMQIEPVVPINVMTIYVEETEKPINWDLDWNRTNMSVVWGYIETIDDGVIKYAVSSNSSISIIGLSDQASLNTNLIIPSHIEGKEVTQIVNSAFKGDNRLKSIYIPNTILEIQSYTFSNAENLDIVIFEENSQIEIIKSYAFYNAKSLNNFYLPKSVIKIEEYAFQNTYSLLSIQIPATVKTIQNYVFAFSNTIIYVEESKKPLDWSLSWNEFNDEPVYWGHNVE